MSAKRVLTILSIFTTIFIIACLYTPNNFRILIKEKELSALLDSQEKAEIILEEYLRFVYYYYNQPLFEYLDKKTPWYRVDEKCKKLFLTKKILVDLNKLTHLSEKIAKSDVDLYMNYTEELDLCKGKLNTLSQIFNLNLTYFGTKEENIV
jgi:hypothetical protein